MLEVVVVRFAVSDEVRSSAYDDVRGLVGRLGCEYVGIAIPAAGDIYRGLVFEFPFNCKECKYLVWTMFDIERPKCT